MVASSIYFIAHGLEKQSWQTASSSQEEEYKELDAELSMSGPVSIFPCDEVSLDF